MSWQRTFEKNFCKYMYGHLDNEMSEVWVLARWRNLFVYYKVLIDTFRSLALVFRKINRLQEAILVFRKTLIFGYSIQDYKRTI